MTIAGEPRAVETAAEPKEFRPGSIGWIADDLDALEIERIWLAGRYELIDGVLSEMPPAMYAGTTPTGRLTLLLAKSDAVQQGCFHFELDIQIKNNMVLRPDACWVSRDDHHRNTNLHRTRGTDDTRRFVVPPTLIIESVSQGHERHDRENKFEWYADFGVPNYWIVDGLKRRLDCFVLTSGRYALQSGGSDQEIVRPSLFAPVELDLASCWSDWANQPVAVDSNKSSVRPPSSS